MNTNLAHQSLPNFLVLYYSSNAAKWIGCKYYVFVCIKVLWNEDHMENFKGGNQSGFQSVGIHGDMHSPKWSVCLPSFHWVYYHSLLWIPVYAAGFICKPVNGLLDWRHSCSDPGKNFSMKPWYSWSTYSGFPMMQLAFKDFISWVWILCNPTIPKLVVRLILIEGMYIYSNIQDLQFS